VLQTVGPAEGTRGRINLRLHHHKAAACGRQLFCANPGMPPLFDSVNKGMLDLFLTVL